VLASPQPPPAPATPLLLLALRAALSIRSRVPRSATSGSARSRFPTLRSGYLLVSPEHERSTFPTPHRVRTCLGSPAHLPWIALFRARKKRSPTKPVGVARCSPPPSLMLPSALALSAFAMSGRLAGGFRALGRARALDGLALAWSLGRC